MDDYMEAKFGEILEDLGHIREQLEQLRQDVQIILQNTPIQMIPADPDAEVQ